MRCCIRSGGWGDLTAPDRTFVRQAYDPVDEMLHTIRWMRCCIQSGGWGDLTAPDRTFVRRAYDPVDGIAFCSIYQMGPTFYRVVLCLDNYCSFLEITTVFTRMVFFNSFYFFLLMGSCTFLLCKIFVIDIVPRQKSHARVNASRYLNGLSDQMVGIFGTK